jgi:tetratricopeptide (TPR) repeat protein
MKKPVFDNAHEAFQRGTSCHQAGQRDETLHWYKKAISIKPDFVEAQHFLNSLLEKMTRQPPT